MTTAHVPSVTAGSRSFTAPVVDYEPPPAAVCPPPPYASLGRIPSLRGECPQSPAALHRHTPRPLRPAPALEPAPPRAAATFTEAALRRILEVIDRRRPIGQLRPLLTPALVDSVVTLIRPPSGRDEAAVLRRVRLRTAAHHADDSAAAEVFATYTRGRRVRAIAARVEHVRGTDRWQLVALQIG